MSLFYVTFYGTGTPGQRIVEVESDPLAATGRTVGYTPIATDPFVQHIVSWGDYLYAYGEIASIPSMGIFRIDRATMTLVDAVGLLGAYSGVDGANLNIAIDGTYLYAIAAIPASGASRVYRIRLSDFTLIDSIATNIGGVGLISNIDTGNGFLYLGDWGAATIDKIRLSDFTLVDTLNMTVVSYSQHLHVKDNYLYVVNGRNLGPDNHDRLCRINLATFTEDTNLVTAADEGWGWTFAADDTYLYLGLATAAAPTKIVRFTLNPFVRVDALTMAGYMDAWTILIDGDKLVVVLEANPTTIHKISRSTFTLDALTLDLGWPPYLDSWSSALAPASTPTPTTTHPEVVTLPATVY